MSELNDNIQNNPEERPLTEQVLQFCDLYVNLRFAQDKKDKVE